SFDAKPISITPDLPQGICNTNASDQSLQRNPMQHLPATLALLATGLLGLRLRPCRNGDELGH
ncbi:MAG TPA: hypothetical protein DDY14_17690, partial [Chromatiaceae bacterium]|nr:hypothetical protein [Chromatiaceae bacterium]